MSDLRDLAIVAVAVAIVWWIITRQRPGPPAPVGKVSMPPKSAQGAAAGTAPPMKRSSCGCG